MIASFETVLFSPISKGFTATVLSDGNDVFEDGEDGLAEKGDDDDEIYSEVSLSKNLNAALITVKIKRCSGRQFGLVVRSNGPCAEAAVQLEKQINKCKKIKLYQAEKRKKS